MQFPNRWLFLLSSFFLLTTFITIYFVESGVFLNSTPAPVAYILDPQARYSPFATEFVALKLLQELDAKKTQQALASFLPGKNISPIWDITVYELTFRTRVETGAFSIVKAQIYVPQNKLIQTQSKSAPFPLVVYGAGTTGLDDRCAPSREDQNNPTLGNYRNQMISQASQGFVVALPNYEGFDNPSRIHYYFNAELEARTLLGVAQVLLENENATQLPIKSRQVFFGGYSQGGHAAFAAADKAAKYTPEITVTGIFGHGPTADISDFLRYNPNLAPYFVFAYQTYYPDFPSQKILTESWLARLGMANEVCVDEAFHFNTVSGKTMYTSDFWNAITSENSDAILQQNYPELAKYFSINDAGNIYVNYPTLFLQGKNDPIIPADVQQKFIDRLCDRNIPVSVIWYENLDHFETRQGSFVDTNNWITSVSNFENISTTCN